MVVVDGQSASMPEEANGFTRRSFVGFLIAGPTLIASASLLEPETAYGAVPTAQAVDHYDLSDALRDSTRPTRNMIAVQVNTDGTVSFDLHRAEVGQGITTGIAMLIAEEMDLPIAKVKMGLADARPELLFNQLTGGSNTIFSLYEPVRTAAASAKGQMMQTAARELGVPVSDLTVSDGVIRGGGGSLTYGELAKSAAVSKTRQVQFQLKDPSEFKLIGTSQVRIDAREAVTGKKQFAMDLKVPGAVPTMLCKPPTINGTAKKLLNEAEIKAMPGVFNVGIIPRQYWVPGGVVVAAKTFGQCIDAIRAMKVDWGPGTADEKTEASVYQDLKDAELPLPPAAPGEVLEQQFLFHFRPGDPLETNDAVADVKDDKAEIWGAFKNPIWTQQTIAKLLDLEEAAVKVHVVQGGGSFGRRLFSDAAYEAALASKLFKRPVKLMWHRADGPRQGRVKPMTISRVRIVHEGEQVVSIDQSHTGVPNDLTHGLGEAATASGASQPNGNFLGFSSSVFYLTACVPYNFGAANHLLNEIYEVDTFNTSSTRNVYSPEVRTSIELLVDQLAAKLKKDPFDFRQEYARDARMQKVLTELRKVSNWGKSLPAGVAQGVAVHREYKAFLACVMEIDTREQTTKRRTPLGLGVAGPRVTRATWVVDVGRPINPSSIKAMVQGCTLDGIAHCLQYSLHLDKGNFLEGSWDHAHYPRQWNAPFEIDVTILPPNGAEPGGTGELGVAPAMAGTACALARATGKMPTTFPLNHDTLGFTPFPAIPPIPESPTDGIERAARERSSARKF